MKASSCGRNQSGGQLLVAISVIQLIAGCSRQTAPPSEVIRPVKTTVVIAGGDSHVRTFPGKVEASKRVELAFQVPGLLVSLPVREGQRVAAGEVIAQLRQDEFQARLKSLQGQLGQALAALQALRAGERPEQRLRLEADVRAAEAKLVNARSEFNRLGSIIKVHPGAVARVDYDRAEAAYRIAREGHQAALQMLEKGTIAREEDIEAQEAVVRGLEGRVVEANLQLEDSTLRAPYDGVIAQRFVEQNQNVMARQPIVRFQDVDQIEIAVDVPETVMAADLSVADILQTIAEFSAVPGVQFPVHISEIAQTADPQTQTFRVRVAMKSPPNLNLLPGMTATVTMTYRRASILGSRILVPISAVFKESTGDQIAWVIGPESTATRRRVTLGDPSGGNIEILEGLEPGDRIAVAGVAFLREGMRVRDLGDSLGGG